MNALMTDLARATVNERLRRASAHTTTPTTSKRRGTNMQRILTSRAAAIGYAVLALLVAVSGTATAAAMITGAQIKDNTVHGRDITNASVTGKDVKDKSLTPADFTGSVQGPPGPTGPDGPQGQAGASGLQYVTNGIDIATGKTETWAVSCPVGKVVVGGGVSSNNPYYARIVESAPLDNGAGWWVGLRNQHSAPIGAYAWAVCATAS